MTLPSSDTYSDYGSNITNYSAVEDPTTDLDASAFNQLRASAAAKTSTAFRAILDFYVSNTDGYVNSFEAVWNTQTSADGYGVLPIITYASPGIYPIIFPAQVYDVTGTGPDAIQNQDLLGAFANVNSANVNNAYFVTVNTTSANTVTVYVISALNGDNEDITDYPYSIQVFFR